MSLTEQEYWDGIISGLRAGAAKDARPCRRPECGHSQEMHEHYHDSRYCSADTGVRKCPCRAYQAPLPRWVQWLRNLPRRQKGNRDAH